MSYSGTADYSLPGVSEAAPVVASYWEDLGNA